MVSKTTNLDYKKIQYNMKKSIIILFSIFLTLTHIFANQRDSNEAYQLAQDFLNKKTQIAKLQKAPSATNSVQLVYSKMQKNKYSANYYYVFNNNDKGFVIVSGVENTTEILGYSDENIFDPQNIPENLNYLLSVYEKEIDTLGEIEIQKNTTTSSKSNSFISTSNNLAASVSPLLGGIKWNQDSPYNDLCPIYESNKRAVTGCVATGMAQVMKYHQWPITGTGSNSYTSTTHSLSLSVDFSQTTFDWANMTDSYNSNSTPIEKNAVATLMYNCGVAVKMDYAASSGAYSKEAARVLISNFGYDTNIQYIDRDYYTRDEWKAMIKEELSAARPVLYSGNSGTSGHFFVCDGYDNNDFFHFNWGWGGTSNGYFRISALDPADQGIGGSVGGYNNYQAIITGIQKPSNTSIPKYLIISNDSITYPSVPSVRNASFTIKLNSTYNIGINSFSGKLGLALYDTQNTYIADIKSNNVTNLNAGYGWSALSFTNIVIAPEVLNGNYKIYCVYKSNTENNWQIVRTEVGTPNYINLTVNSDYIYFSTPTNESPILILNSLTQTGNLYSNKIGRINATISNNGKEYNSQIKIKLQSATDPNISQLVSSKSINITAGETRELNFTDSIKLPAGNYYMSTLYSPKNESNGNEFIQLGNNTTVTVLATPTTAPILTLNTVISFPDANNVNKDKAILTAQITNTGGLYDKKMIAFIFPKTGGSSLTYIGYQSVIIDENETKNLTFQGPIDLALNEYYIKIYYQNNENVWTGFTPSSFAKLNFTLINDLTAVSEVETLKNTVVFPNPASNTINIQSVHSIRAYRIFNLIGEEILQKKTADTNEYSIQISNLKSGSYIIQIETEAGISNLKFIKQ